MATKQSKPAGELIPLFTESIFPHLGYKVDDVDEGCFYAEKEEDGRFIWVLLDRGEDGEVILSFSVLFIPWDEDLNPEKHFNIVLDLSDDVVGLDGWWNADSGRLMITYELSDEECTEEIIQNTLTNFYKFTEDFNANYLMSVIMDQVMDEEPEMYSYEPY